MLWVYVASITSAPICVKPTGMGSATVERPEIMSGEGGGLRANEPIFKSWKYLAWHPDDVEFHGLGCAIAIAGWLILYPWFFTIVMCHYSTDDCRW